VNAQLKDRARGVLLGMACGDALGAQVEFKARGTFPHQTDFTGKGPHRLKPGQWTDDTAMALLLADHLRDDPEVRKPALLANRWIAWYRKGTGSCTGHCFDIGMQTVRALHSWEEKGVAPNTNANTKMRGNGALMRVAPVALAHDTLSPVQGAAYHQALVTHGQASAELCSTFAGLLWRAMRKDSGEAHDQLARGNPALVRRSKEDVRSTGYDVDTYEAALWCVLQSSCAEEAIIRAANLGDDADTVAAVTGAMAGAVWGDTLPRRWLDKLAWRGQIVQQAEELCEIAAR
jgi:ADP-ribosyl-[dinitrogen reductase] hydrolase